MPRSCSANPQHPRRRGPAPHRDHPHQRGAREHASSTTCCSSRKREEAHLETSVAAFLDRGVPRRVLRDDAVGRASACARRRRHRGHRSARRSRRSCTRSSGICATTPSRTARPSVPSEIVEIRHGRLSPSGAAVSGGRGPRAPVSARSMRNASSSRSSAAARGTGLGLFLARELAQTNGATLLYEPRHGRRQHFPPGVRGSTPLGGLMTYRLRAGMRAPNRPYSSSTTSPTCSSS